MKMIKLWHRSSLYKQQIGQLYQKITEQSRAVDLYKAFSIPDTIDGRYEVFVLHTWLVLQRLRHTNNQHMKKISQGIFDSLIMDFDLSLREVGVGDKKLGKQVRFMTKGVYGRFHVYDQSWGQKPLFFEALQRNFFGFATTGTEQVEKAYHYILNVNATLSKMADDQLLIGGFIWPDVSTA